ncbi:phage tail protein [Leptospira ilyithenensis]|uniref:Phage tail protein n=1 Tax=Leptospira ilyithenensis TaxID=2484901 RepID=A0A4V6QMS8_9LEPT|nr:tail fiber protein [Leptospira ilyithenensis]TGN10051.1 phage tail protein [Leptospira ilyithenensis]
MLDPYLGEITLYAFNFAPPGWAACNGALLQINQYQALYSLLGTTYGGDGVNTFALPDLRGCFPIHSGLPNNQNISFGKKGGQSSVTLTEDQLPSHTHPYGFTAEAAVSIETTTEEAWTSDPENNILATPAEFLGNHFPIYKQPASVDPKNVKQLGGVSGGSIEYSGDTQATGLGNSIPIMPPFLGLNFCIAIEGAYPPHQ